MALTDIVSLNRHEPGIAAAIAALRERFGDRLSTSMALRQQHGDTVTYLPNQPPDAVIFALSTEDVQHIVRICAETCCPIIPFGTGTSLEGGVNAPAGGICIDLSRMNRIPNDADELHRAEGVIERLALRALAMEGTCTGEHGIGQGKRRFLRLEHGTGVDVMAAIKQAIDPHDIMNPGKVLPSPQPPFGGQ